MIKKNIFLLLIIIATRRLYIAKSIKILRLELAILLAANYSVGVGNATDGMEIFLEAIGLKNGDEIIISSHTMLATASAIKVAGGVPVQLILVMII